MDYQSHYDRLITRARTRVLSGYSERHHVVPISDAQTGKKRGPHSEKTKRKISLASKGRKKSDAHRAALANAKLGTKRGPHSEQHKANLSIGIKAGLQRRREFLAAARGGN